MCILRVKCDKRFLSLARASPIGCVSEFHTLFNLGMAVKASSRYIQEV